MWRLTASETSKRSGHIFNSSYIATAEEQIHCLKCIVNVYAGEHIKEKNRSIDHELVHNFYLVSMIRKYHNQTLQTNSRHRDEEPQNNYANNTSARQ